MNVFERSIASVDRVLADMQYDELERIVEGIEGDFEGITFEEYLKCVFSKPRFNYKFQAGIFAHEKRIEQPPDIPQYIPEINETPNFNLESFFYYIVSWNRQPRKKLNLN